MREWSKNKKELNLMLIRLYGKMCIGAFDANGLQKS
jgi:hypothetical protein